MNSVVRVARYVAPFVEFLGALGAAILAILANGNLQTDEGRVAVILAIVAAVGHAVMHTTDASPGGSPPG